MKNKIFFFFSNLKGVFFFFESRFFFKPIENENRFIRKSFFLKTIPVYTIAKEILIKLLAYCFCPKKIFFLFPNFFLTKKKLAETNYFAIKTLFLFQMILSAFFLQLKRFFRVALSIVSKIVLKKSNFFKKKKKKQ